MIVVDDHTLFRVLARRVDLVLANLIADGIVTTASWYFRLARALSTGRTDGMLSRQLEALPDAAQAEIRAALDALPAYVEIVNPRTIVPLMATIATITPLNFLTLEALATAIATNADIATATATPLLQNAADQLHITIHIV